jgi:hypothetical protein
MSLEQSLRLLIAEHGLQHVHTALNEYMREEYEFLSKFFEKKSAVPVSAPAPVEVPVQENAKLPAKHVKVKVRKAEEAPAPLPVIQEQEEPKEETRFRSPTEMKEFQKAAVEKKHAELLAQGIKGESVLTKDNLNQWLTVEGNTYAWVAREKSGCPESKVAAIAKGFGIKSSITKLIESHEDST